MSRYIDADNLNLYDNLFMSDDTINKSGVYVRYRAVENLIKNAPTADVQEVKHGKWDMIVGFEFADDDYKCSLCHCLSQRTKYCPNCGAMMD